MKARISKLILLTDSSAFPNSPFAKCEFGKALESVNRINFDILAFKYEIKNLQIMLLYELGETESLIYALDSYKHFASNNKYVSESTRENIFRFIGYTGALCKLKDLPEKMKINMLKDKIEGDNLNTKYWLLEKTEELLQLIVVAVKKVIS